jgi:hypothetical protein
MKGDTMKIHKLSGVLIILLLIIGIVGFILSNRKLSSSQTAVKNSGELSIKDSLLEDEPADMNSTSVTDSIDTTESDTTSGTVETSAAEPSVLDLNDSFLSCHTEPEDVDAESGATTKASIYGNNLSIIPAAVLINKASVSDEKQSAEFKGIVIDFKPMIIVTGSSKETKITFDLTAFEYAEGQYTIIDMVTQEAAASFTGTKGVQEVNFDAQKSGGYAIIKDNYTLGLIEVVDDLGSVDLEEVRKKYIY